MKVYLKLGNKTAKEKQMVKEIEEAIAKKKASDPSFDFNPAEDMEELKRLHREMIAEDVEFEETKTTDMSKKDDTEFTLSNEKDVKLNHTKTDISDEFIDPFNREEPIVRDYVLKDEFAQANTSNEPKKTSFGEPMTFDDAFAIPNAEDGDQIKSSGGQQTNQSNSAAGGSTNSTDKKARPEPVNPEFDTMKKGQQNKQTKRFAKRIVGAVSMLLERGFVWWTTKNINPAKLAEYEVSGEMDLDLILSLEGGQQATVRDFFAQQCAQAEQMGKISEDDQQELAEALADVMMEKGITPSPTQVLIMSALEIVGRQAITAIAMSSQTNALLAQLRTMKQGGGEYVEAQNASDSSSNPVDYTQHTTTQGATNEPQTHQGMSMEEEENEVMQEQEPHDETETGLVKM